MSENADMGATSSLEPAAVSTTRARTTTVQDAPPELEAERLRTVSRHPDALRRKPTPYELLLYEIMEERSGKYRPDGDGLHLEFPGGSLDISGEAMAQSVATIEEEDAAPPDPASVPANETREPERDETNTDSSPGDASVHPNLGERVL